MDRLIGLFLKEYSSVNANYEPLLGLERTQNLLFLMGPIFYDYQLGPTNNW